MRPWVFKRGLKLLCARFQRCDLWTTTSRVQLRSWDLSTCLHKKLDWHIGEYKTLCAQYRVSQVFHSKTLPTLMKISGNKARVLCLQVICNHKLEWQVFQGHIDTRNMKIHTWKKIWKLGYFGKNCHVQCVSTASCERTFLMWNCIKRKHRN